MTLCLSCRLTRVIPDLDVAGHRDAWYRLEVAKRRLLYTLLELRLPVVDRQTDPAADSHSSSWPTSPARTSPG